MPPCDIKRTLDAHNALRKRHGAPPLQWDATCAAHAQLAVDEITGGDHPVLHHCHLVMEGGQRMGQNIAWGTYFHRKPDPEKVCADLWYAEVDKPGYHFNDPVKYPDDMKGTGHFTQLVWYSTTHVGMAKSKDGKTVVANYFPAGNVVSKGLYENNVLPKNTAFEFRARNAAEQQRIDAFESFDRDYDGRLDKVEFDSLYSTLKSATGHVFDHSKADIERAFAKADGNGDGSFSPQEFIQWCSRIEDADAPGADWKYMVGFQEYDADGNGAFDKREFVRFLSEQSNRRYTTSEAAKLFDRMDVNNDGVIDVQEFKAMVMQGYLEPPPAPAPAAGSAGAGGGRLTAWSADLEAQLKVVPSFFQDMVDELKEHLQDGGAAELTLGSHSIKLKLISDYGWSTMSARWG